MMKKYAFFVVVILISLTFLVIEIAPCQTLSTLTEQNEALLRQIKQVHTVRDEQMAGVRAIFKRSMYIGQGNPGITKHPVTTEECETKLKQAHISYENPMFERICGGKYMAPLYNPATERIEDASACIDQFEFPNIPCAYPVVWVRAIEAAKICEALGKRLCDAHEWEGACAGSLEKPDYHFQLAIGKDPGTAISLMREAHNHCYEKKKTWSYGPEYKRGICAASGTKSPG
ncbi:MAG: hypothetical protein ACMUIP_08330 [bacterium]